MPRSSPFLILCAGTSLIAAVPSQAGPANGTDSDELQIRALQQEWMDSWVRQDRASLERILAPDYSLTISAMPERPISRDQWMATISRYTAKGFEYRDMKVRLFGDVAVVSSIGRGIGANVNGVDRSFPFFLTDVWVKRDGRWQVAARYSSLPESGSDSSKAVGKTP